MGSIVDNDMITKQEPPREGSCSEELSTPDPDLDCSMPDAVQQQKRKGGRKPIYATSEERKQRNRQAQAAFRERRTEYIKQLETTIRHNEDALHTLQRSHRSAADECLMLRYKNSLLERILVEKGINVHAELRMKNSDRPRGGPVNHPSSLARAAMSRHAIAHRRIGIPSKSDPTPIYHQDSYGLPSPQPQTQPQPPQPQLQTPPSAVSSPSAMRSPYFMQRLSPAASDIPPPPAAATQPPVSLLSQPAPYHAPRSVGSAPTNDRLEPGQSQLLHPLIPSPVSTSNVQLVNNNGEYYKASPLQKHYDQLDQEYSAQADLVEDDNDDDDDAVDLASYPYLSQQDEHARMPKNYPPPPAAYLDPFDPVLGVDMFGMPGMQHFQTPFGYNQLPQMR